VKAIAQKIIARVKKALKRVGGAFKKGAAWVKGKAKGLKKKFDDMKAKRKGRKDGKKTDSNKKKQDKEARKKQEAEKRAERARRELPPKIKQFLARKPSRLRLWAQLLIWKAQYRLSSLKAEGSAANYRILGTINPKLDLAPGWSFEEREVFAAIDRIAKRIIGDAKKEMHQNKQLGTTADEGSIDLRNRQEAGATVAAMKGEQSYITGETVAGDPIGFSHSREHALYPGPFGSYLGVAGLQAQGKGHEYRELAAGLNNLSTGTILASLLRKEKLPNLDDQQRSLIGEMHGLWFGKEPKHNRGKHRRDLVYGLMVTELMTPGATKALTSHKGVSLHPAAFGGAQTGAGLVTKEMSSGIENQQLSDKQRSARRKRLGRERGTLILWFRRHMKDLPQLDRPPSIADVEAFVETKIQEFLEKSTAE
jgi:hypothetical protein